jgi:hypothetical protein
LQRMRQSTLGLHHTIAFKLKMCQIFVRKIWVKKFISFLRWRGRRWNTEKIIWGLLRLKFQRKQRISSMMLIIMLHRVKITKIYRTKRLKELILFLIAPLTSTNWKNFQTKSPGGKLFNIQRKWKKEWNPHNYLGWIKQK